MPAPGAAPVAEPLIAEPTCGSVPLEIWMVSLAAPVRLAALLERLSAPLIAESASVLQLADDVPTPGCEASRGDAERRVETISGRSKKPKE